MTDLSLKRLGVLSIDQYVLNVAKVWTGIHPRRTVLDCALHSLNHASRLGDDLRNDVVSDILRETAHTANWLFGFVGRLNRGPKVFEWEKVFDIETSLSRMIWDKFPNLCPHCFERIYTTSNGRKSPNVIASAILGKCMHCLVQYPTVDKRSELKTREERQEYKKNKRKMEKSLRAVASSSLSKLPPTLKELEEMFHRIYKSNVAVLTIESIGFHLLEEAGELARAVIDLYTSSLDTDEDIKVRQGDLCDE